MEANIHTNERMPKVNIIAIRDMLSKSVGMNIEEAEAIAKAIDMGVQEQDITGFATKGDVKELKNDILAKMENLKLSMIIWILSGTFAINQIPNILNWVMKIAGK